MSELKNLSEVQFHISSAKKQQENEDFIRKQQYRHDWLIAIFNAFAGGIAGLITSIIFWLVTK